MCLSNLVVSLFFELFLKVLNFLLEVLEFLGELMGDSVSLQTVFGREGGTARPVRHDVSMSLIVSVSEYS